MLLANSAFFLLCFMHISTEGHAADLGEGYLASMWGKLPGQLQVSQSQSHLHFVKPCPFPLFHNLCGLQPLPPVAVPPPPLAPF